MLSKLAYHAFMQHVRFKHAQVGQPNFLFKKRKTLMHFLGLNPLYFYFLPLSKSIRNVENKNVKDLILNFFGSLLLIQVKESFWS